MNRRAAAVADEDRMMPYPFPECAIPNRRRVPQSQSLSRESGWLFPLQVNLEDLTRVELDCRTVVQ